MKCFQLDIARTATSELGNRGGIDGLFVKIAEHGECAVRVGIAALGLGWDIL
jgi:hypothetical protein